MFAFTEASETRIEKIMAKYPPERKISALLPLLTLAQAQEGYITPEAMTEIGKRLDVSPAYVESVCHILYDVLHQAGRQVRRQILRQHQLSPQRVRQPDGVHREKIGNQGR